MPSILCSLALAGTGTSAYIGLGPLPTSSTVVYKVNGGDDAKIGNFTIDSDGMARFDETDNISGPQGAVLTATVTQVIVG